MRSHVLVLAAILILGAHAAQAQGKAFSVPPADITGAYDTLPSGEKQLADSLYAAQTGRSPWTRDQIATARVSGAGWGEIFQEMRGDGLLTEASLARVVRRKAP